MNSQLRPDIQTFESEVVNDDSNEQGYIIVVYMGHYFGPQGRVVQVTVNHGINYAKN